MRFLMQLFFGFVHTILVDVEQTEVICLRWLRFLRKKKKVDTFESGLI